MVYVLSQIRESECVSESITIKFNSQVPQFIILAKLRKIEFYHTYISEDKSSLELIDVLNTEEPISALGKLICEDRQWLIILTESQKITILGYNGNSFIRRAELQFVTKGHQRTIDSNIKIISPKNNKGFFIVHNFQGFVQLVVVNQTLLNENEIKTKQKKHLLEDDIWSIKTIALGNIVVQKMVLLEGINNTLVVLYRDFNYNYSMRFYTIDLEYGELKLIKQCEEFDTPPADIVGLSNGGVLVLSGTYTFYFPNPEIKYLSLTEDEDESLSINSKNNVVTKISLNFVDLHSQDLIFRSHTIIDDSRILAITSTGMTFLIYLSAEKLQDSVVIKNIRLIKLGYTTISNSLHYISNGIFFASSNLSQSVLFNIYPESPFINICEFVPSSPPVLDIDIKTEPNDFTILTCQGGYDSGEFIRIDNSKLKLNYLKDLEVPNAESLQVLSNSSTLEVRNRDYVCGTFKCILNNEGIDIEPLDNAENTSTLSDELFAKLQGLGISTKEQLLKREAEVSIYLVSNDGSFVYVSNSNKIQFCSPSNLEYSFDISKETEVSDIDLLKIKEGFYAMLISFWNNGFELYLISQGSIDLILNETTIGETTGIFSGKIFYDDKREKSDFWIILLNLKGSVIQYNISILSKKRIPLKDVVIPRNDFPLRIIRSSTNEIFLYNKTQIISMLYDLVTDFFNFSIILRSNGVIDISIINDNIIAILNEEGTLKFYKMLPLVEDKKSYSNFLNLKSTNLPDTNLSVIISLKRNQNEEDGELEKCFYLRLIDNQSMKILNIYQFPDNESVDLTGITYIPNEIDPRIPNNTFIVLSNSSRTNNFLSMFTIKNNKIVSLPKIEISGLVDVSKVSFVDIIPINADEDFLYFVYGSVNLILHLDIQKEEMQWKVHSKSAFQLPTIVITGSSYNDRIIVGDMLKGIYNVTLSKTSMGEYISTVSKISPEYEGNFLTSLAIREYDLDNNEIIFSDSLGNISSLILNGRTEKYTQTSAFNIGEQVNVLKTIPKIELFKNKFHSVYDYIPCDNVVSSLVLIGTVGGAIYHLGRVDDEDIEETLSKCTKELMVYFDTFEDIPTKSKKLAYQKSRYNWKSLKSDDFSVDPCKESFGIVDLSLIKRWLQLDMILERNKHTKNDISYPKKYLKHCYQNRCILEKVIHDLNI